MKALIVGFGSIGKRHARILQNNIGLPSDDIYIQELDSARQEEARSLGYSISSDSAGAEFDICVVAASTSAHIPILSSLRLPQRLLYIEKPLAHDFYKVAPVARKLATQLKNGTAIIGYMLRHHPAVVEAKTIIESGDWGKVLKYRAECGMYLPNWHPWEDYRDFYMSQIDGGGGALLDISHEIDLMCHLVGDVTSVIGKYGNLSDLECSSDDFTEMILSHENNAVGSISLDLIQKDTFRKTRIVLEKGEIEIDFVNKRLTKATAIGEREETLFDLDPDDLYISQYKNALSDDPSRCCNLAQGLSVMEIIEAVRQSSMAGHQIHPPIYSG